MVEQRNAAMTPNTQASPNSNPAPLDRAKQLAATLLSGRGEASGTLVARELHQVLRILDGSDRHGFQRYLASEFQPDKRHCAQRRNVILPTPAARPRPRLRWPPIRLGRNC
jgi:hypothetical protein